MERIENHIACDAPVSGTREGKCYMTNCDRDALGLDELCEYHEKQRIKDDAEREEYLKNK